MQRLANLMRDKSSRGLSCDLHGEETMRLNNAAP